jgi:hypothetical protein
MASDQDLLIARGMGIALSAVLTDLFVSHATLIGGNPEQAVRVVRKLLNESLSSLEATATTIDGERHDSSEDIKSRVGKMLDFAESNVRRKLNLPPLPSKRH